MGLLAEAFNPRPRASAPDALSNFWYTADPSGYITENTGGLGLAVSPDSLLRCGTVLAAIRFRGDSWAMCPPSTYRKTSKGRVEVPDHYSQIVLRNPNRWQTGNRWRHLNGVWMALWGNAYNEMVAGARSVADELWPMHPSTCRVVDQRSDGSLLYLRQIPGQDERRFGQERVLHFRDLSTDGIKGVDMYRLIRNVVGIALMAERHQTTFLAKGTRISGLIVPSMPLDATQRQVLRDSVNQDLGGTKATGTFGIMPHGVKLEPLTLSNREQQFAELDDRTVGSILRFLGVPGVVVGWADKTATYASAEAFFEKGGIKHCVLPILINAEAEEEKALLPVGSGMQIKHNLDVLERANLRDRTESLVRSVGGPFRTVNEARRIEDMDRLEDPRYDEVAIPVNMDMGQDEEPEPDAPAQSEEPSAAVTEEARLAAAALTIQKIYLGVGVVLSAEEARKLVSDSGCALPGPLPPGAAADRKSQEAKPEPSPEPPPAPPAEEGSEEREEDAAAASASIEARARWFAQSAAGQVGRREAAAILDKAPKYAKNAGAWRAWVESYYTRHAEHVSKAMGLPADVARSYCDGQAALVLRGGVGVVETLEKEATSALVALALEVR